MITFLPEEEEMYSHWRCSVLTTALLSLLAGQTFGQLSQEIAGAGTVDWTLRVVKATGIGKPLSNIPDVAKRVAALEAARIDARKKLLETVKGVNITSEITVGNHMMEHTALVEQVRRVMKDFKQVGDERYLSDLSVEVDVEVSLNGELSDLLLPETGGGEILTTGPAYLCPLCGQSWPADKPVPTDVQLVPASSASPNEIYTGLIIDTRGLRVQPAIAPRVLNEEGKQIYGVAFVDREYAISQGMVRYSRDIEKMKKDKRVGTNPLIIKAVRPSGARRADIVER
jgi:hypothetical protein